MKKIIFIALFLFVCNVFSEDRKCILICNDSLVQKVECEDVERNYELRKFEMQSMILYLQRLVRMEVYRQSIEVQLEMQRKEQEQEQNKKN